MAYSTLPTVLYGPAWKIVVRIHSVLYRPLMHSVRALSPLCQAACGRVCPGLVDRSTKPGADPGTVQLVGGVLAAEVGVEDDPGRVAEPVNLSV